MSDRAAIRTVVAEGLTREFPRGVRRDEPIPRLAQRVAVIKGIRRSGKTYRLFQRANELLSAGVERERILFVDFEDDRLQPLDNRTIARIVEEFLRSSNADAESTLYLFFDEVQAVPDWGRTLRRLSQDGRYEIVVSGSSAKMLSDDVDTEFRGRSIAAELYPYSFREFLRCHGMEPGEGVLSPDDERTFKRAFDAYLTIGGFPEVQGCDAATRAMALQGIARTITARDLSERHGLPVLGTRFFIQYALRLSGREFSVNKIYNTLHSMQIPLSKEAANSLPSYCEDAYLFFLVPRFGADFVEAQRGRRKLYAIDPGLQLAMGSGSSVDRVQALETSIYIELRRRLKGDPLSRIGFYRTSSGYEVDFVVGDEMEHSPRAAFQVSADVSDSATLARETRALSEALDETGLDRGFLIVGDGADDVVVEDERLRVIDAWRWMLGDSDGHTATDKSSSAVPIDEELGYAILPSEWDDPEDDCLYDELV